MSELKCKKLLNSPETCVDDCLEGFVAVNPGLRLLKGHRVVVRADVEEYKASGKVAVISGGGSGHEPSHAGYVGHGMLTGAVCGAVFASPPPNSILAAIRAVGKGNAGGVLLVIKNYTGDRLNFGIAAERAKSAGIKTEMVVVDEDCALTSSDKTAGRRGLCGTVFIHKIAGALAEQGRSLEEIVPICTEVVQNMGTIGVSLSPCTVPGAGPSFSLAVDEMELGLGIHGEAGVKRIKLLSAKETVVTMIDHMTNPSNSTHLEVNKGDKVALIVNNLGGTSVLEMNVLAKEAIQDLERRGVTVERAFCGTLMSSLEMSGISLTLLHLDEIRKTCLDAETSAIGWQKPLLPAGVTDRVTPKCMEADDNDLRDLVVRLESGAALSQETSALVYKAVKGLCDALIANESQLNELDTQAGDGDCGSTLKTGALALLKYLGDPADPGMPVNYPECLLLSIAAIVEQSMGGSSGAMYSLFLTAAAGEVSADVSVEGWARAFRAGMNAISKYGGAEPGDRTMLDAMHAASEVFSSKLGSAPPLDVLGEAVKAAETMAQKTAGMKARAGRASYVSQDRLVHPDPGAVAVAIWLKAVHQALQG